jgi:hypothetical protein
MASVSPKMMEFNGIIRGWSFCNHEMLDKIIKMAEEHILTMTEKDRLAASKDLLPLKERAEKKEKMYDPSDVGTEQVSLEDVFQVLLSQKFADWYNEGMFYEYIAGESTEKSPSKGEVLESLLKMIRRK